RVNTDLALWETDAGGVRRAGVSAFGFGGTNFHTVMEEYVPGRIAEESRREGRARAGRGWRAPAAQAAPKAPLRGVLLCGAGDETAVCDRLRAALADAKAGRARAPEAPAERDLNASVRVAIDYGDAAELAAKITSALDAFAKNEPARWRMLRAKGIFVGRGEPPKVAFLFTGQGSQYVNMLRDVRAIEPVIAETYAEADGVMEPLLPKALSDYIFFDGADKQAMADAEHELRQTVITQPAVLATETALARLLGAYGIAPDLVMGHSLGEYGALVAAGAISFANGLRAVSARGGEMTRASREDNGKMAAVFGPIDEVENILASVDGYVVVANINSTKEAVIGGDSAAVERAIDAVREAGFTATPLPVSHAFHTRTVAAASAALGPILEGMGLRPPEVPIVANISGEFYPMGPGAEPEMIDILSKQVASPVQFVKGLRTLYDAGARLFVEVGPKRALYGFASDVVGGNEDVVTLFTNHPRIGGVESFNQALCGLYAAGLGVGRAAEARARAPAAPPEPERAVVITGASVGLPGTERVFDDLNVERILRGEQFIDAVPMRHRRAMADKAITRLVKSGDGNARFETIDDPGDVIKLAARAGAIDLAGDFGFPEDRLAALDVTSMLAIGAGIDALRDAGIPLVMRYKTTTRGTRLPDRWMLPEELRDETGVIFASAFPGYDAFAGYLNGYHEDRARRLRLSELESLRSRVTVRGDGSEVLSELESRIDLLRAEVERAPFQFDRRFLFRVLAMGHSQFAEYIGARGPNTQINSACASGTQAVGLARDWIRQGMCRRVIVISADNITSENLLEWFGAGFLASGAAATDELVEDAAVPFDRRRHGLLIGMGAAGIVVERADAAQERGVRPIAEVLSTGMANSAFHGTRLDVGHIRGIMEDVVARAERDWGIDRREIARETVFVSHETYTPARGGSASAEVEALRHVFGEAATDIVVANTKGYTGHPMGVAIEDAVALKILETGLVPAVPNFKEVDPELGRLNLSVGGSYPVRYALRLAAGFGSQIGMTLTRWV
ncbi:MAG: acyltransferase domain-containing protein, partial [Candidatus Krumholzibacteria bacterium]|nr:acyltransferase domain-containing protein [Candidatus Krumholzibacteria bacterium]